MAALAAARTEVHGEEEDHPLVEGEDGGQRQDGTGAVVAANVDADSLHHQQAEVSDRGREADQGIDDAGIQGDRVSRRMGATPSVLKQSSPEYMQITDQERQWALRIKRTVEADPELDDLNDMMYAHLAIYSQGDLGCAMKRVHGLQAFKKEYNIADSLEEGMRCNEKIMLDFFVGFLLSFGFDRVLGTCLLVCDATKIDKQVLRCPRKFCTWMQSGYYLCQAYFPNLEAVRKGTTQFFECEGYDWSLNMFDLRILKQEVTELHSSYPTTFHQVCMYHTPMAVNLMISLVKRSLPENLHSKFVVGCTSPGRIDQFYAVPNAEAAARRALGNLFESLKIRYENERTFRL